MLSKIRRIKNLPFIFVVFETTFIVILLAFFLPLGSEGSTIKASEIFFGIGASLIAWIFVYFATLALDKDMIEHHDTTKEIFNVVKEKYMSLVSFDRSTLNDDSYEKWYDSGNKINIAGIALGKLSAYMKSAKDNKLIELIQNQEKAVRILFLHPESSMALARKNTDSSIIQDINETKQNFVDLQKILSSKERPKGTLHVKMTRNIIYSSIFHVEDSTDLKSGVMLLGLIFCHQEGAKSPLYEVPRCHNGHLQHQLYSDCKDNFDELFNDSTSETLIQWPNVGNK